MPLSPSPPSSGLSLPSKDACLPPPIPQSSSPAAEASLAASPVPVAPDPVGAVPTEEPALSPSPHPRPLKEEVSILPAVGDPGSPMVPPGFEAFVMRSPSPPATYKEATKDSNVVPLPLTLPCSATNVRSPETAPPGFEEFSIRSQSPQSWMASKSFTAAPVASETLTARLLPCAMTNVSSTKTVRPGFEELNVCQQVQQLPMIINHIADAAQTSEVQPPLQLQSPCVMTNVCSLEVVPPGFEQLNPHLLLLKVPATEKSTNTAPQPSETLLSPLSSAMVKSSSTETASSGSEELNTSLKSQQSSMALKSSCLDPQTSQILATLPLPSNTTEVSSQEMVSSGFGELDASLKSLPSPMTLKCASICPQTSEILGLPAMTKVSSPEMAPPGFELNAGPKLLNSPSTLESTSVAPRNCQILLSPLTCVTKRVCSPKIAPHGFEEFDTSLKSPQSPSTINSNGIGPQTSEVLPPKPLPCAMAEVSLQEMPPPGFEHVDPHLRLVPSPTTLQSTCHAPQSSETLQVMPSLTVMHCSRLERPQEFTVSDITPPECKKLRLSMESESPSKSGRYCSEECGLTKYEATDLFPSISSALNSTSVVPQSSEILSPSPLICAMTEVSSLEMPPGFEQVDPHLRLLQYPATVKSTSHALKSSETRPVMPFSTTMHCSHLEPSQEVMDSNVTLPESKKPRLSFTDSQSKKCRDCSEECIESKSEAGDLFPSSSAVNSTSIVPQNSEILLPTPLPCAMIEVSSQDMPPPGFEQVEPHLRLLQHPTMLKSTNDAPQSSEALPAMPPPTIMHWSHLEPPQEVTGNKVTPPECRKPWLSLTESQSGRGRDCNEGCGQAKHEAADLLPSTSSARNSTDIVTQTYKTLPPLPLTCSMTEICSPKVPPPGFELVDPHAQLLESPKTLKSTNHAASNSSTVVPQASDILPPLPLPCAMTEVSSPDMPPPGFEQADPQLRVLQSPTRLQSTSHAPQSSEAFPVIASQTIVHCSHLKPPDVMGSNATPSECKKPHHSSMESLTKRSRNCNEECGKYEAADLLPSTSPAVNLTSIAPQTSHISPPSPLPCGTTEVNSPEMPPPGFEQVDTHLRLLQSPATLNSTSHVSQSCESLLVMSPPVLSPPTVMHCSQLELQEVTGINATPPECKKPQCSLESKSGKGGSCSEDCRKTKYEAADVVPSTSSALESKACAIAPCDGKNHGLVPPPPPPLPPLEEMGQMVCGHCRELVSYPHGASHVRCAGCRTINFVLEAHEVGTVHCGSCSLLLMYQYGAPSVRCVACQFVTLIGAHNIQQPWFFKQEFPPPPLRKLDHSTGPVFK